MLLVILRTTSQLFFKFCMTFQCRDFSFSVFTLYTLQIRKQSKWKFWEFQVLRSKITKFFIFFETANQFSSILHHSSLSWDITPLYFFWMNFYILSTKGAYQSTNLVKFHVSSRKSKILYLDGSFCANHIRFQLKKYRRIISHDTVEWYYLKKNWLAVSNVTWGIWCILVNFHATTI